LRDTRSWDARGLVRTLLNVFACHIGGDDASSDREMKMKTFLIACGLVLGFLTIADFTASTANDERTHARWAAQNKCLDTNTAALPEVQRMCEARAMREVP
jgi:hypothetical protein